MNRSAAIMVCVVSLILCAPLGAASAQPSDKNVLPDESVQESPGRERKEERKGFRDRRHHKKADFDELTCELGLTAEQREKMDQLREKEKEQAKALMEQIRQKKEALGDEIQKEQLDMEKINGLHAEIKSLTAQREDGRLQGILRMREILTQEQFKKFHDTMGNRKGKFKGKYLSKPKAE